MNEEVYLKLAERLDAIPNGFPSTESGVELRLLAKIFTPEEATLASVMRLTTEPASEIAERAGIDAKIASSLLKDMSRKGQIRVGRGEGTLKFGLMPFFVGFYEEQLPRMDAEMATLFEEYMQETHASSLRTGPSVHRVIPVKEAVPFDLEIFPYERATELIENAKSWGVRDCICRVQQRLIGNGCDHPVENCLVFAPVENAFDHGQIERPITKEESLRILHEAEQNGLVHSTSNQRERISYICNCCTCCCGILRGVSEFDIPTAVAHSGFYSVVDVEICSGCKECLGSCSFHALSISDEVCVVDYSRCVGCGLCALACSMGALHLEVRPDNDRAIPPSDIKEWMLQRAQERNISIFDIL